MLARFWHTFQMHTVEVWSSNILEWVQKIKIKIRCAYKEQIYMLFSFFYSFSRIWHSMVIVSHLPHNWGEKNSPTPNHTVASLWKAPSRVRLMIKNCETIDLWQCYETPNWRHFVPRACSKPFWSQYKSHWNSVNMGSNLNSILMQIIARLSITIHPSLSFLSSFT